MAIAATLGAIGALAFSNYLDQYKVGLEGMAAQESAEPMVDAAVQNLQSGANVYLSQYYFGPPIAQQITPVLQNYLLIANALHQYIEYSRCYTCYVFFPNAYGYSVPIGALKINLGPNFFSAPMVGVNSKAGTIIHELSHLVAGTRDYAYGGDVHSLTTDQGIHNADSYEYYAEVSYSVQQSGPQP
jgi:hypothetical protein